MKSIGHFQFIHVSPFIKSPLTPIAPQNKMQKFQKTSRKSPPTSRLLNWIYGVRIPYLSRSNPK